MPPKRMPQQHLHPMPPRNQMSPRHPAIISTAEIEEPTAWNYPDSDEAHSLGAAFGRHFGFHRLGIHHERLPAGQRSSFPHAESSEDEFIYVIEGTPDVWLDGHLHRLKPGDGVGFAAGTGLAHAFLNNTDHDVRLLVVGDTSRADNKIYYAVNPERRAHRTDWWDDIPDRSLGPHDGLTDARRAALAKLQTG